MPYTDDAMITVLQKAETAAISKAANELVIMDFEDQNEKDCYAVAAKRGYIKTITGKLHNFCPDGLSELHRLLETRERSRCEKTRLRIDKIAIILASVRIVCSATTTWILTLDHYRLRVRPVSVIGAVEVLPYPALPHANGNENADTQRTNTDTSETNTNAHSE